MVYFQINVMAGNDIQDLFDLGDETSLYESDQHNLKLSLKLSDKKPSEEEKFDDVDSETETETDRDRMEVAFMMKETSVAISVKLEEGELLELTQGVGTKRKMDNLTEDFGGNRSKKICGENQKSQDSVRNEKNTRSGLDQDSENSSCEEEIQSGIHTQDSRLFIQENTQGSSNDENLNIDPDQAIEPCENDPREVSDLVDKFPDIESLDEEETEEYEDNVRTSEPDLVVYSERTSSEAEESSGIGFRDRHNTVLYARL